MYSIYKELVMSVLYLIELKIKVSIIWVIYWGEIDFHWKIFIRVDE